MTALRMRSGLRAIIATSATAALLLTGCGGADDEDQDSVGASAPSADLTSIGLVNQADSPGEIQRGGTLDFGVFSQTSSLDPAISRGLGTNGGTALAAIYDVLIRYNPESREYEPQLAKSMKPNDDSSVWTLKLREGINFSDGTPLNAEAVVWSVEHYMDSSNLFAGVLSDTVVDIKSPDRRTVVFTLTEPWPLFQNLFTYGPGFVLAPSSVKGEDFTPIGAGAYAVERFAPGEELVLKARKSYWGGAPYLDELRFAPLKGAQAKLDTLRSGGFDVAFLRHEGVIVTALTNGRPGFLNLYNAGSVQLINNAEKRPGGNPKVRKAIAYALDTELLNQRVAEGKGLYSKKLFQEWSTWATEEDATPYDPDKARKLLDEAEQETGYDGEISYNCYSTPEGKNRAVAIQSLLEDVGFDVTVDLATNVGDHVQSVIIDRDYDMACWGYTIPESVPWIPLANNVGTPGTLNLVGYSNSEMDALLAELKTAPDDKAKREVINQIQELWTETVPSVVISATPELIAWNEQVHGVVPTARSIVLLHDAWIE